MILLLFHFEQVTQTALNYISQNNGLLFNYRKVNNRQTGQDGKFLDVFYQIKEDESVSWLVGSVGSSVDTMIQKVSAWTKRFRLINQKKSTENSQIP